jgi:hypothetical protein
MPTVLEGRFGGCYSPCDIKARPGPFESGPHCALAIQLNDYRRFFPPSLESQSTQVDNRTRGNARSLLAAECCAPARGAQRQRKRCTEDMSGTGSEPSECGLSQQVWAVTERLIYSISGAFSFDVAGRQGGWKPKRSYENLGQDDRFRHPLAYVPSTTALALSSRNFRLVTMQPCIQARPVESLTQ